MTNTTQRPEDILFDAVEQAIKATPSLMLTSHALSGARSIATLDFIVSDVTLRLPSDFPIGKADVSKYVFLRLAMLRLPSAIQQDGPLNLLIWNILEEAVHYGAFLRETIMSNPRQPYKQVQPVLPWMAQEQK